MNPRSRRIEGFLADRKKEFTIAELAKTLNLREHKVAAAIQELRHQKLVVTRYENSTMYVKHIGWREGNEVRGFL